MVAEWSTGQLMRIAQGNGVAVSISSLFYILATWNIHLHIAQRFIYAIRASPMMPVHRGSSTRGGAGGVLYGTLEAQDLSQTKWPPSGEIR